MITLIKNFVPPIIWRMLVDLKHFSKRSYALNLLDKKLEEYLPHRNGFYVELGANDGISQSNTYFFEKYRDWRGILVEPIPFKFLECCANRSNDNAIYCNACVSFEYPKKFVEMVFANLMSISVDLESDIKDTHAHVAQGSRFLGKNERTFSFGARASTLNDLLAESGAPECIDLLSLDVEGSEIEVLKGVDHQRYRFKFICIECRDIVEMIGFLEPHGYVLVSELSSHDYLFADSRQDGFTDVSASQLAQNI